MFRFAVMRMNGGVIMKIGLYGIRGTYNFGCEAIVRGAVQFINDVLPRPQVVYFSYSFEFDKKALADLDIVVVPLVENYNLTTRVINKLLDVSEAEKRLFPFSLRKILDDIDLIISIGGDIYTIPSFLREKEKYKYYNPLVDFCERSKKPVVVYGASVGPWGVYERAVDYYKRNLSKYRAILCRERETVTYLEGLGLHNTYFFPDPAFQLGEQRNNRGQSIGINLSPLSLKEIYGDYNDEHIERLASLTDRIYEKTGRDVVFLPHVLSKNINDNDLFFLKKVRDKMKHSENVSIADSKLGFLGIKEAIRDCFIVISARMHCAINALEENVPTIFLSYSQKSIGMCQYVYKNKKWVISIADAEQKLITMVLDMCDARDELNIYLDKQNERIKKDYAENLEQIKELLYV